MYLFSCDLLLVLYFASSLGSLMVSDSTELYLIWVQQKGLFKYKLCEWQHVGSMCEKMDVWKWLVSGAGWQEVTACPVHNPCTPQMGTSPPRPGLWDGGLPHRQQVPVVYLQFYAGLERRCNFCCCRALQEARTDCKEGIFTSLALALDDGKCSA